MISHSIFNLVGAKYVFQPNYLFTDLLFTPLLFKELKSPVNINWNSAYLRSLFCNESNIEIKLSAESFRHSWFYRRLHSSNSDNNRVFAVTFVSIELSWKPFYRMLLSVSWLKMLPPSIFHRQFFPFLVFGLIFPVTVISVFPVLRYLFEHFDWLISPTSLA
jgi:hypothetical protein